MTYRGHIANGALIIDSTIPLPDGAQVIVNVRRCLSSELHPDIVRFSGLLPADLDWKRDYHAHQVEKHQ